MLTGDLAEPVRDGRRSRGSRKAASSRPGKRKADAEPVAAGSESDEDDFERMDLDKNKVAEEQLEDPEGAATPDKSDLDATEDEDEDDLDPVRPVQSTKSGIGSKGKAIEVVKKQDGAGSQSTKASPPPRRELPFNQRRAGGEAAKEDPPNQSTTEPQNAIDEEATEGETDDDEL